MQPPRRRIRRGDHDRPTESSVGPIPAEGSTFPTEGSPLPEGSAPDTEPTRGPPLEMPGPGAILDTRYRIIQVLGETSSSRVYQAFDQGLDFGVAVKLVRSRSAALRDTLRTEARAALRLTHPNIVRVYSWCTSPDWDYLVMELVDGGDLHRTRTRHPGHRLPLTRALDYGIAALDALAYAHGLGVLHRDVKPSNLLLSRDGVVKLCDFGLAAIERVTTGGGTPVYMSPERLRGYAGDARSDVYAMGATLYTLVTGDWPFDGDNDPAARSDVVAGTPALGDVDLEVTTAIRRAMAPTPVARFPNARAFRDELLRIRMELAPEAAKSRGRTIRRIVPPWAVLAREEKEEKAEAPERLTLVPPPPEAPAALPVVPGFGHAPVHLDLVDMPAAMVTIDDRTVPVAPWRLARLPVTNRAWREFLAATDEPAPAHWLGSRPPAGREDHPVVGVSLAQARRYCEWVGGRLPTESEFVSAVRGGCERRFPWGDECDGSRCQCPFYGAQDTAPVGMRPGSASGEGVHDLLGNVWEWVEPDPRLPAVPRHHGVAMGGSFETGCFLPGEVPRTEIAEGHSHLHVGVRVATDALVLFELT